MSTTSGIQQQEIPRHDLARQLFANSTLNAYAVLDGAANPALIDHLYGGERPEFECLYRGELEPDMAECAPYLAKLVPDTPFCDWVISSFWGNNWGIFALSREGIQAVRQHLRKLNMAYDPESHNPLLFRYYDPRVLSVFLPTCDGRQCAAFFGPIQTVYAQAEGGEGVLGFMRNGQAGPVGESPQSILFIRPEQMEVFRQSAALRFENEMVSHCREFAPELGRDIGEDQLRLSVRDGISRANSYGFTHRGPIRLYLELMLLFGSAFDRDPQYPWAASILKDNAPQMQRAEVLYEGILDYQEKVSGPDDCNTREALWNLSFFANQPFNFSSQEFVPAMHREIAMIFPQKAAYLGGESIQGLIREGCNVAKAAGFTTSRGYALIVVLMFGFGHGCANDPLYPWIAQTLRDERIGNPDERAARLEKRAMTWLHQVLEKTSEGVQS